MQLAPPTNGELGLAEGIETALSATEKTGKPCWAVVGPRLHQIDIPSGVQHLYIFSDNDGPGAKAEARAHDIYNKRYDVTVWRPPEPHKDWNDFLRAEWEARGE